MATKWRATFTVGMAAGLLGGCSIDGGPAQNNALMLAPEDVAPASPGRSAGESVQAVRSHLAKSIPITPDDLAHLAKADVFGAATPRIISRGESFLPEGFGEAAETPARTAQVTLPKRANGVFHVADDVSGIDVTVKLKGARDVAGENVSGIVAYPRAYEGNADILHRPTPHGTEDYLFFPTTLPEDSSIRYEVTLGEGVRGLRLVGNNLEMLDAAGAPRLRMEAPYAIAADGRYVSLDVALEGCAYSTDKRLPYGRPLVDPGARACGLRISWSDRGLVAPLLVDPGWVSTKPTTKARSQHTATLLKDGRVLVAGGAAGASAASSHEVYDPATATWTSPFSSLQTQRYAHTATLLDDGTVLVVGGKDPSLNSVTKNAEVYNPQTNTWTAIAPMAEGRMLHTATRLSDGRVLVVGGDRYPLSEPSSTAELFDPVSGTWSPAGSLVTGREVHTATLLKNDRVIVVGGISVPFNVNMQPAPMPYKTTKIWNPDIKDFENGPDTTKPHVGHIAEPIVGDRVLVAGGSFSTSAEVYDQGSNIWKQAGSMTVGRILFASAPLPGDRVLVMGSAGDNVSASQTAEVFDPKSLSWTSSGMMVSRRGLHTATRLKDDRVLVVGGTTQPNFGNEAELYTPLGTECSNDLDCADAFCVDGVCCNALCDGQCEACNGEATLGICTPVVGTPVLPRAACSGTDAKCGTCDGINGQTCAYPTATPCATQCTNDVLVETTCDGMGNCTAPGATNNCAPYKCGTMANVPACLTECSAMQACAEGAVCNEEMGICITLPTVCLDDRMLKLPSGMKVDCAPFVCRNGACLETCGSVDDCIGDAADNVICDELTATCKKWAQFDPTPAGSGSACDCSIPGQNEPSRAPWLLAIAATLVVTRRKPAKRRAS